MSNVFTNNAVGALASGITNVATSLTLGTGQGALFATLTGSDYSKVTIFQYGTGGETNHEIVKVTARSGDTLTIVRGQEGTTGRAFSAGDIVECRVTADAMNNPNPAKTTYGQTAVFESVRDLGTQAAAVPMTFDVYQNAKVTLSGNAVITLGTPAGIGHYQCVISQDGTGGRAPTWAGIASTNWLSDTGAPVINTDAAGKTMFNGFWDGTQWFGSINKIGAL